LVDAGAALMLEHLLDLAKALVAEQGFHGVSIEGVARRAGITRPIVYRHFGELAALLDALVERETLRALVQLSEVLPAHASDLIAAFDGSLRARPQRPGDAAARARPARGRPGPAARADRRRPRGRRAAARRRGRPAGRLAPTPSATRPSASSRTRAGSFPATRQNDLGVP
jgi:AcrR family transcriptional regulator